jgi:hypothetical protein
MASADTLVPLFLDEEKQAFDQLLTEFARSKSNLFALRARNLGFGARDAELVATAYLLTNVILMARASRKIFKVVALTADQPDRLYAQVNVWRTLFGSAYSSLANIRRWRSVLADFGALDEDITAEVERAIEFFAHADIGVRSSTFERAEVHLGIEGLSPADPLGGQFELKMSSAFCPTLITTQTHQDIQLNGIYTRPGFTLRSGGYGRNILLEIDGSQLETALTSWIASIPTLVDFKFYRAGAIA